MTEHGKDMSELKSSQNRNDYPPVTYLTMAYEPINTMHAVISAIEQDYPGEKTIVLIHQEPGNDVKSNLIKIINVCVPGEWPALWLAKLEAFCKVVDPENIVVWWDEDDRFSLIKNRRPSLNYTQLVAEPIVSGVIGAWTDKCYYVKKGAIVEGTYPRSNGTLAIRADALKAVVPEVRKIHPEGYRIVRDMRLTVDPTLIKVIAKHYGDRMMDHDGMRYYFMRSGGNGGPRRRGKGVNIDE